MELAERLHEAWESGKLNLSYLGAGAVEDGIAQAAVTRGLRVVELDLSSNALEALPPAVASAPPFAGLRLLRFKYNRLAALPVQPLAALPQLEALELEGNQIAVLDEGALPTLGALRRLNLAGNGLGALPECVGRCRLLEVLTLSNNPLTQLPEGLAACPITHLDVSSCRLVSLPAALAQCKTLQRFFCQNNDLPKVPTALGHLPSLKEWNLRANRLPLKYEQARERGLAKFLAFLREEEEIETLQEIERNRPVGIASGPCMIYRCKAVLDDVLMAARVGEPIDGFAWIRSGYAMVQHRNSTYVFGGTLVKEARKTAELLVLSTDTMGWYEWVETDFSMQPNRSRIVLFDNLGRLSIAQCGHPLHKLNVGPEQIEKGSCIWDVVQLVPLSAVQEKEVRPEDLEGLNAKRDRIKHATLIAGKLPRAFSTHTPREQQLLAASAAFKQRWLAAPGSGAGRLPPCVTLPNECGVEKSVCMTLRWAAPPHTELHDLDSIARFVSEFFTFEPLENLQQPPSHLVSPWSLLEWQAGDSFDLASLACSLLIGSGYNAFVAVGYTNKQVALGDQSRTECPWMKESGLEAPPYADLPEEELNYEEADDEAVAEEPAAAAGGAQAEAPAGKAGKPGSRPATAGKAGKADTADKAGTASSRLGKAGKAGSLPANGAPQEEEAAPEAAAAAGSDCAADAAGGEAAAQPEEPQPVAAPLPPPPPPRRRKHYVHAFVLVKPGRRDVMQAVLLDPGTGRQYSMDDCPCTGVEYCWNDHNFWVSLQTDRSSSDGSGGCSTGLAELGMTDWSFTNPNCWQPVLLIMEDHQAEAATITTQLSLHSSKASSDMLGRMHPDSRGTPTVPTRISSLSSSNKGYSPRTQVLLSSASAAASAGGGSATRLASTPGLCSSSVGGPPGINSSNSGLRADAVPGGVALHTLALCARNGTPRLSVYAPTRELMDSSLDFLCPEETAQRSSLLPGNSTAALLPTMSTAALLPTASGIGHAASAAAAAWASPAASPTPGSAGGSQAQQQSLSPEMPLSWVPQLNISRERLDMRCPRGQKVVTYRQARRELFARYGECGRWDGLVERLTTYDGTAGHPLCVLELFSRRKDRLVRRLDHPGQRTTLSSYKAGAIGCLKSIRMVRGMGPQRLTDMTFYAETRADGLIKRVRNSSSLEEWFLPGGRPDGLTHRAVQYTSGVPDGQSQQALLAALANRASVSLPGKAGSAGTGARVGSAQNPHRRRSSVVAGWEAQEQVVASIREQFSCSRQPAEEQPRGPAGAAAEGMEAAEGPAVLERFFDLATGLLQVVLEEPGLAQGDEGGRVTRTYRQDGELVTDATAAGAAPAFSAEEQQRERVALVQACRAAQGAVLAAEDESRDILQTTQRQEQGDALETPHYDAMRVKVEDSDSGEAVVEEEPDSYDFLAHFLPHTGARDLTAREAEQARAACLAAFDDRQADRFKLLRTRLAECSSELGRLRAIEQTHLSPADQERVRSEEAAGAFRMKVVQRRVNDHAPAAAAKRAELEGRLDADRRLAQALASAQA